jgi:diguanylate cyclase (GGDEF)-like protein
MRQESGRTFDPQILNVFVDCIGSIEPELPAVNESGVMFEGVGFKAVEQVAPAFALEPVTPTEKALLDIAAAQREILSLYEISQTLGSTLKLSEVLPIVATKFEHVARFSTLVIYLAEIDRLSAAYVIGRNSERLKGLEMSFGAGGAGWVAENHQPLVGGSPRADLEKAIGPLAAAYNGATILPLCHRGELVGTIALYCEEQRGHSADEVRLLEAIALHAATAIHNARAFERTKESALTDSLTGLPNSRYMYSFFGQERGRAQRHGYPLVLMMMDLDGFKRVNDTYGHHIGDQILRTIADIARSQLRASDTLIRYAGDEFVAVLHRATPETVMELKGRLQATVETFAHEVRPGRVARVGISIGYATYGTDGNAIDELMEVADRRMYQDKLRRRGRPALRTRAAHQLGLPGV